MCQMSVDKRFKQYVPVNPEIDNAKLIIYHEKFTNYYNFLLIKVYKVSSFLNFTSA